MNITEKIKQASMSGGIMVESSAGTGKTYTMIEKVKHEVEVMELIQITLCFLLLPLMLMS